MSFFFGRRPNSQEEIDERIEKLKDRGIKFHYDRADRMRSRHSGESSSRLRIKKMQTIMLFILIAFSAFILVHNCSQNKKGEYTAEGDNAIVKIKKVNLTKEDSYEINIIAKSGETVIPKGGSILFRLFNNKETVYENRIAFPQTISLQPGEQVGKTLFVHKGLVFRAIYLLIKSDTLGIEKEFKIR